VRVLYFSERLTVHDCRFLKAYLERGHRVAFLRLLAGSHELDPLPVPAGVETVAWPWTPAEDPGDYLAPGFLDVTEWSRAADCALAGREFDVVHAGPLTDCAWIASRLDVGPLLAMSWGSDILGEVARGAASRARARAALQVAEWVQCDCDAVRESLVDDFGVEPARIIQFPWGIDTGVFSPERTSTRREPGMLKAISLRSWEPVYDIKTALRGFAMAAAQDSSLVLVLAGDGSLRGWVEEFVARSGLQHRVELAGRLDRAALVDRLRQADVYLSCSRSDGSSISLLEAMSVGAAPIVSDIPGNREWVRNHENGWLVPVGDARALADAILASVSDPATRARFKRRNRRVVLERASWPANVVRLFEAIENGPSHG
jgi:glycosyltransferase involved in cell wall biosynthesis